MGGQYPSPGRADVDQVQEVWIVRPRRELTWIPCWSLADELEDGLLGISESSTERGKFCHPTA